MTKNILSRLANANLPKLDLSDMLQVVSANLNGIRSANSKGFFDWVLANNFDVICIQELKCADDDLPENLRNIPGYYAYFSHATKKGYSGVAIYSKIEPESIIYSFDSSDFDDEGRYIEIRIGDLSIVSLYLPSGSSGEDKQLKKYRYLDYYLPLLSQQINSTRDYIICGDFNIAHQEIDIKNWKANQKHSGFLPEERQWLSSMLQLGFIDTWRHVYPDIAGYTWWSNRGQAYTKDVGWRIDYQIISPKLINSLSSMHIYKETKFSDHAPLIGNYAINLTK